MNTLKRKITSKRCQNVCSNLPNITATKLKNFTVLQFTVHSKLQNCKILLLILPPLRILQFLQIHVSAKTVKSFNLVALIFGKLELKFYCMYLGYWHQRADERHGNPPPR